MRFAKLDFNGFLLLFREPSPPWVRATRSFSLVSYHIKTCQLSTSAGQSIASVGPLRYLSKVEDFFTTTTFLKNVANLPEYLLLVAGLTGVEPAPCAVTGRHLNRLTLFPNEGIAPSKF